MVVGDVELNPRLPAPQARRTGHAHLRGARSRCTGRCRRREADAACTEQVHRRQLFRASGAPPGVACLLLQREAAVVLETRVWGTHMKGHTRKRGEAGSWEYIVD